MDRMRELPLGIKIIEDGDEWWPPRPVGGTRQRRRQLLWCRHDEGERMRVWGGRREVAMVLNASMGHVSHFGTMTNDVAGSDWPVWSCHLLWHDWSYRMLWRDWLDVVPHRPVRLCSRATVLQSRVKEFGVTQYHANRFIMTKGSKLEIIFTWDHF
jgi:hypothetical protein